MRGKRRHDRRAAKKCDELAPPHRRPSNRRWHSSIPLGVHAVLCSTATSGTECPLWVKSRHWGTSDQCPRYPQKRTSVSAIAMSALCQKRTFCAATKIASFDHLVGGGDQRLWDGQTKRFGGL